MNNTEWLLKTEPASYAANLGYDPYAIWVSRLNGADGEKVPARLLAYADTEQTKAHIIYLDGEKGIVNCQQMSGRKDLRVTAVCK